LFLGAHTSWQQVVRRLIVAETVPLTNAIMQRVEQMSTSRKMFEERKKGRISIAPGKDGVFHEVVPEPSEDKDSGTFTHRIIRSRPPLKLTMPPSPPLPPLKLVDVPRNTEPEMKIPPFYTDPEKVSLPCIAYKVTPDNVSYQEAVCIGPFIRRDHLLAWHKVFFHRGNIDGCITLFIPIGPPHNMHNPKWTVEYVNNP
jgi:hypothetical protein